MDTGILIHLCSEPWVFTQVAGSGTSLLDRSIWVLEREGVGFIIIFVI